jgi:hypothetical protein
LLYGRNHCCIDKANIKQKATRAPKAQHTPAEHGHQHKG